MALRKRRGDRGVATIDFAFIMPLLFVFVFAVFGGGLVLWKQHTLQFATREGARLGLVGRTLTDANGNPMSRQASIVKEIQDLASIAMPPSMVTISFYPIATDFQDPAGWQGTQDAGQAGQYMRVRTSYTFRIPLISIFDTDATWTLSAQSTYRNEFFN